MAYKDHVRFQQQLGLILKVHADGLKKRDKKKNRGGKTKRKHKKSMEEKTN